jgi:hypothetical protein
MRILKTDSADPWRLHDLWNDVMCTDGLKMILPVLMGPVALGNEVASRPQSFATRQMLVIVACL